MFLIDVKPWTYCWLTPEPAVLHCFDTIYTSADSSHRFQVGCGAFWNSLRLFSHLDNLVSRDLRWHEVVALISEVKCLVKETGKLCRYDFIYVVTHRLVCGSVRLRRSNISRVFIRIINALCRFPISHTFRKHQVILIVICIVRWRLIGGWRFGTRR